MGRAWKGCWTGVGRAWARDGADAADHQIWRIASSSFELAVRKIREPRFLLIVLAVVEIATEPRVERLLIVGA